MSKQEKSILQLVEEAKQAQAQLNQQLSELMEIESLRVRVRELLDISKRIPLIRQFLSDQDQKAEDKRHPNYAQIKSAFETDYPVLIANCERICGTIFIYRTNIIKEIEKNIPQVAVTHAHELADALADYTFLEYSLEKVLKENGVDPKRVLGETMERIMMKRDDWFSPS